MGLMARAMVLASGRIGKKDQSKGQAVIVTGEAEPGNVQTPEVWSVAGVWAIPPDGSHGVYLPVGSGGLVVAVQNYGVAPPTLAKGEAAFGSTTADGKTIKALMVARADGTLELNGDGKRLVTWDELNTALATLAATLTAHVHPSLGSPSPGLVGLAVDISAAKTTTLKTGG